jgi:glutaminyl-peptide cyclotransferase
MRVPSLILSAVLLLTLGCRPVKNEDAPMPKFNGQRAFAEVEALVAYSPRDAGTPDGWKAADHIAQRLKSFGLDTTIDTFADMTPEGEKTFRNVSGRIPGTTDRWIILGSHFDTMPGIENFQGANDSGSSTGVLLELARMLRESDITPATGLLFAFFDGEEGIAHYVPGDGLHGSRRMASQLIESGDHQKIDAMILLDMVGDRDLQITLPRNSSPELTKLVLAAARDTGHRNSIALARDSSITDDHVPFLDIGIPAIDLIDFKFGSEPGLNDYWHTDRDSLDNISAESLQITGEIVLKLLERKAYQENSN